MQFVGRVAYEEDEPGPYFGLTLLLELLDKLITFNKVIFC